jgi:hypothetical protein
VQWIPSVGRQPEIAMSFLFGLLECFLLAVLNQSYLGLLVPFPFSEAVSEAVPWWGQEVGLYVPVPVVVDSVPETEVVRCLWE